jgi:hypothetical protein
VNISETTHADSPHILSRLADALASTGPISNIDGLMADAEQALEAARERADALRDKSLSPALPPAEVITARSEADAAAFHAVRLASAMEQLEARAIIQEQRDRTQEHRARRQEAKDAVAAVAARLRTEYGPAARTIASLAADIVKADALVARANAERHDSEDRLYGPDGTARGFPDLGEPLPASHDVLRIIQAVVPHPDNPTKAIWPPVPLYRLKNCNGMLSHDTVAAILRGIADAERR